MILLIFTVITATLAINCENSTQGSLHGFYACNKPVNVNGYIVLAAFISLPVIIGVSLLIYSFIHERIDAEEYARLYCDV